MSDISHSPTGFFTVVLILVWSVWFLVKTLLFSKENNTKLPPSPPKLPIIGHLHRIGHSPHRSLHSLSKKHGGLMLLHLGSKPAFIVSSANLAKEILDTHDLTFANRSQLRAGKRIFYDGKGVLSSCYGDEWRKRRSILVHQLLHSGKFKSFTSILDDENDILVRKIKSLSCGGSSPINLAELIIMLTNNTIQQSAFGEKNKENERTEKSIKFLKDCVDTALKFTIGELIPWLAWMNELNGFNAKVERIVKMRDEVYDAVFKNLLKRRNGNTSGGDASMGDILIDVHKDDNPDFSIDEKTVKALLLDINAGGTETTAKAIEWAMAELIRHPQAMKKLQDEVREILNRKQHITEQDLDKMQYLKAVIKETLRCHPIAPLFPRESREDVNVIGYEIPSGSMVLINAWAIGQDPDYWEEPEMFKPERFLESSIDFKGFDYQFIPFGAGRRICPGISFVEASMERVLANLVHKFDWALPDGEKGEDLDMSEQSGLTVGRKNCLMVVATKCYF